MCASGVVCSMEEGQECRARRHLDSSLEDRVDAQVRGNRRFATDELHEVLSSVRLSQFNSDTDGCQECSQVNSSRRRERDSCGLLKWIGGQVAYRQACATSGQMPESQCGLHRGV